MKRSSKDVAIVLSLMIIYILLTQLGVYQGIGILLFPILSMPFVICLIKNYFTRGLDFLFNIVVMIGIYLLSNNIQSVYIYSVSVCVPGYIGAYFYKKEVPLPNMIMYLSIGVASSVFLYLQAMKYLGIDYVAQFILGVDETKMIYFSLLETIVWSTSSQNILEQSIMKEFITLVTDTIKKVYPALILSMAVIFSSFQLILLNIIIKHKGTKLSILKQIFNFKLSKVAVLILFIAMIVPLLGQDINDTLSIASLNVLFFLQNLMQIMGVISIVVLLKRASVHNLFKALGYIMLVILLITPTNILMMFGCFDTLFNYRKAQIIV